LENWARKDVSLDSDDLPEWVGRQALLPFAGFSVRSAAKMPHPLE
jgi:hypothetical protein